MSNKLTQKIRELKDEIESKDELIQLLESNNGDLEDELENLRTEMNEIECYNEEREEFAGLAFKGGYEAKEANDTLIRGWLNYKVSARI